MASLKSPASWGDSDNKSFNKGFLMINDKIIFGSYIGHLNRIGHQVSDQNQ